MTDITALPLLTGRTICLEDALDGDDDVLAELRYPEQEREFWDYLIAHRADIETLVCYHLNITQCHVCVAETWKTGSFNTCVPILIPASGHQGPQKIFIRFPLPYKLGEVNNPGNVEEKLRTEIAVYIWLRKHCPDISIPTLYGFGLPDGQCFTHPQKAPFFTGLLWEIRRSISSWLRFPTPCDYVRRRLQNPFKSGYILLSEAKGEPLHRSWEDHRHDKSYRSRLFRDLARLSLSLNKISFPRIGSLTIDSNGVITLSNRPLTLYLQKLENEGIPSGIPRERTYTSIEPYLSDLLSFQDHKILHQPNAIHDQDDGKIQLSALTALRATMHHFIRPQYRDGPFFLTLTDLHRSNIFVDKQWNIQTIIDLEWACTQPVEMQLPPYWLTSKAVDGFKDAESVAELNSLLEEYFEIYKGEEQGILYQVPIMRHVWETGSFWYFQAVLVPKGMYKVFNSHIQPLFNKEHCEDSIFDEVFSCYWGMKAQEVITQKVKDKEDYTMQVKRAFSACR